MAKQHDGGISWTETTWNPVTGCTRVSHGCEHCYAERLAAGRLSDHPRYAGTTQNGRWSGHVNLHWDLLEEPLGWRKPRLVFVCSMSDVFHVAVPDNFLKALFEVMARTPQHTYQILTKRPARLGAFARWMPAALPNVWIGTSVEDQPTADIRIGHLYGIPVPIRWLSVEPMLGPVELSPWLLYPDENSSTRSELRWVVCGAESGLGARPMKLAWARDLRDQCAAAGIPFWMKQLGHNGQLKQLEDFPEDLRVRQWPVGFMGPGKKQSISVEEVVCRQGRCEGVGEP